MSMTAGAPDHVADRRADRSYVVREYRLPAKVFHWLTAILVFVMISAGVLFKQLGEGPVADTLYGLHKLTGVLTLTVVLLRLLYRLLQAMPEWNDQPHRRPVLHWTLYGVVILVPLLGWAGVSDFGALEVFPGYSLPAIWPTGAGYDVLLLKGHVYLAFALLALVVLHIGVAMQDYMTDERRKRSRAKPD